VALAQGCAGYHVGDEAGRTAHERFLAHRFVEDWGYQYAVRQEVAITLGWDAPKERLDVVRQHIETGLRERLAQLPGLAEHWHIRPGSIRLPWGRFFEVDFELDSTRG
jgi:hypothetical protein